MNQFITSVFIGLGLGIIVFPICLLFYLLIKNTKERRNIKRLMKQGKFLVPIDPKDYDVEAWKNKKYGNIDTNETKKDLDNLNIKIFKKVKIQEDNPFEDKKSEIPEGFLSKATEYLKKAREMGYTDEFIKDEFKKKNYTEDLINNIFEDGRK